MNDEQAGTLNAHLASIAHSLGEIAKTFALKEQRAAIKAAAKAQKRASRPLKK